MRKCGNCVNRCHEGWGGLTECCIGFEMAENEKEEIMQAEGCPDYAEGTPACFEEHYCPSATAGDYSPGNPWDAPGMSIRDFI